MSEVTQLPPTGTIEPVYLNERGGVIGLDEYIEYEKQEADRYLNSLVLPGRTSFIPPRTMMVQIAALGTPPETPRLPDFDLRFYNGYGMLDDAVFEGAMEGLKDEQLIEPILDSTGAENRQKLYGLDAGAYDEISQLHEIYDFRQTRSGRRLGRLMMGRRHSA